MEASQLVDIATCYMVFQTKNYASLVSASPKSISDKRAAKKRKSRAKIVFLDIGTTVRHTFLSSELQCLPHGDPRNLCVNTRIRFLATHSLSLSSIPDKPENIHLMSSAVDNKVCIGEVISFNCSANANPGVTSYQLFENETAILNTSAAGMWSKTLESGGVFVYKCVANNSLGSEYSTSVSVTVNGKRISPSLRNFGKL